MCVSAALSIQHVILMLNVVICGLSGFVWLYNIFPHYLINSMISREKNFFLHGVQSFLKSWPVLS
jgi:hypothetical protein